MNRAIQKNKKTTSRFTKRCSLWHSHFIHIFVNLNTSYISEVGRKLRLECGENKSVFDVFKIGQMVEHQDHFPCDPSLDSGIIRRKGCGRNNRNLFLPLSPFLFYVGIDGQIISPSTPLTLFSLESSCQPQRMHLVPKKNKK